MEIEQHILSAKRKELSTQNPISSEISFGNGGKIKKFSGEEEHRNSLSEGLL